MTLLLRKGQRHQALLKSLHHIFMAQNAGQSAGKISRERISERKVWTSLKDIPYGETRTCGGSPLKKPAIPLQQERGRALKILFL
jgi:O6-methylguanine-DNA--protein-cysteine methyltransferase